MFTLKGAHVSQLFTLFLRLKAKNDAGCVLISGVTWSTISLRYKDLVSRKLLRLAVAAQGGHLRTRAIALVCPPS